MKGGKAKPLSKTRSKSIINVYITVLYRAINNYLDQRTHWIFKRISKSRLSDALDARKYFGLHIPITKECRKYKSRGRNTNEVDKEKVISD
jgi:hypothetical protein